MVKKMILLIGLAALFMGCDDDKLAGGTGDGRKDVKERVKLDPKNEKIETYSSQCLEDPENKLFTIEKWSIGETSKVVHRTTHLFKDENCQEELMATTLKGTYEWGQELPESEGAMELNLTLLQVIFIPKAEEMVAFFNESAQCGISSWALNGEFDVTGKTCGEEKIPGDGDKHFQISKVEAGVLYLGDEATGDGSALEKRPTQLDKNRPFSRSLDW